MPPDDGALDRRAVRRAFGRAAATYDAAAALQREVGKRLRERLDYVKLAPRTVMDAGCGTGDALPALGERYPHATLVGVDLALPMLVEAGRRKPAGSWLARMAGRRVAPLLACADIEALPFARASADLVHSSLALQWLDSPAGAFAEFARVLRTGGLLSFATFGPDTLKELRVAFDDGRPRVSRFVDMHDLGDALVAAGFADPVMDMEHITVTYAEPRALLRELKAIGATNALRARSRGLLGKAALARAEAALESARHDGRIPATFEIVYGHAWKVEAQHAPDGRAIVHFDPHARGR
jgi:malonyl-CoA O-methyltransferase